MSTTRGRPSGSASLGHRQPSSTGSRAQDRVIQSALRRLRVVIRGAVQGVGYRPFVYGAATEFGLNGWVNNTPQGVVVEVEGVAATLDTFLNRLFRDAPPLASIQSIDHMYLDAVGFDRFEIRESISDGDKNTLILPDIATCGDCLRDVFDPGNRRFRYPFTNCTNCGPRYSIITALPYDRANTSMAIFDMCTECRAEYTDPLDRRFHAQPNACPSCGPHLELWDKSGRTTAIRDTALSEASNVVRSGGILALKGLGGFHLIVDARNDNAVRRLRRQKHRDQKPLAVMAPSPESAGELCRMQSEEERLLHSPASPIVLLPRRASAPVAPSVAPGNPYLGLMLPYTPLHHLLMTDLGFPVVATSGNLAEESICTDENDAMDRLAEVADCYLVHNRPIVRHIDDSVTRVVAGRALLLRRARGYAPLPIAIATETDRRDQALMGLGAHQKNTVAFAAGPQVFVGQHNGDLSTRVAYGAFEKSASDFERLFDREPGEFVCDLHPDYLSTRYANSDRATTTRIQHHLAHVFACMADNRVVPPLSGVSWDGTGYGPDGTIWGGEFLAVTGRSWKRAGHLRPWRLPGGDAAIREPRRAALGLLYEVFAEQVFEMDHLAPVRQFSSQERRVLRVQLANAINAPVTSSAGRLFDVLASLIGLCQIASYEGQAAMELEFRVDGVESDTAYPFVITGSNGKFVVDWEPIIRAVIFDLSRSTESGRIAAKFHNTLAAIIVDAAHRMNHERVLLTGGCFQNKYLTEKTIARLTACKLRPYWHRRVPPNDGGISLGQVAAALHLRGQEVD
ncbi:MAG: carbamoyltransferase HypF [Candidatus Latescibacterota bacterium]|nr:MAG: carbamoyltransferase HypF [Candidatus Latescibacterota bacterium]